MDAGAGELALVVEALTQATALVEGDAAGDAVGELEAGDDFAFGLGQRVANVGATEDTVAVRGACTAGRVRAGGGSRASDWCGASARCVAPSATFGRRIVLVDAPTGCAGHEGGGGQDCERGAGLPPPSGELPARCGQCMPISPLNH